MRQLSILIPHFHTWRWTAICIHALATYGVPVPCEIILVDNSPGDPSIKAISETDLVKTPGLQIIPGDPNFTAHGQGYSIGYNHTDPESSDVFCMETDSFPVRGGWFDEYVKASATADLVGPEMKMGAGTYIHPAGALYRREIIEEAKKWQSKHYEWVFCPGAGSAFGVSDKACHVVAHNTWLAERAIDPTLREAIEVWKRTGPFQEMRCFDEEGFENYMLRTRIQHLEPHGGKETYNKIGFEAGQFLSYFAEKRGFRVLRAPCEVEWMPGKAGQQAAFSRVFGGFLHVWAGSVSSIPNGLADDVRAFKVKQCAEYFAQLPPELQRQITQLEQKHPHG